jgi:hypothetical protein
MSPDEEQKALRHRIANAIRCVCDLHAMRATLCHEERLVVAEAVLAAIDVHRASVEADQPRGLRPLAPEGQDALLDGLRDAAEALRDLCDRLDCGALDGNRVRECFNAAYAALVDAKDALACGQANAATPPQAQARTPSAAAAPSSPEAMASASPDDDTFTMTYRKLESQRDRAYAELARIREMLAQALHRAEAAEKLRDHWYAGWLHNRAEADDMQAKLAAAEAQIAKMRADWSQVESAVIVDPATGQRVIANRPAPGGSSGEGA